jgi:peroxin-3
MIIAISRAFTLLYTLALLTMLTRVQLNLLGRRSYLSSVVSLASGTQQGTISLENYDDDNDEQAHGNDFETNRRYLTFSWWLLNRGWQDLRLKVEAAVREVFGHLSPRDSLSFHTFSELTLRVRKVIEGATPEERRRTKWLPYLLPPQDMEDYVIRESGVLDDSTVSLELSSPSPSTSAALRRLIDETSDLIESPAFTHVLTLLLDSGFSGLVDKKLSGTAFELPPAEGENTSPELKQLQSSKTVQLPKILSVLTRQAHAIGNGMPNEYLQDMEQVRDLEGFAAVVYSSNWENEIREESLMQSAVDVQRPNEEISLPSQTRGVSQGTLLSGDESVVVIESQGSFESAWERAVVEKK